MVASTEIKFTDILCELFSPEAPPFTPAVAQWAPGVKLTDAQKQRMVDLAERASRDDVSEAERREMDSYLEAGNILTVLHAKARLSLMQTQKAN